MAEQILVPTIIRGEIIEADLVPFSGRGDALTFCGPDPTTLLDRLPLRDPTALADLEALSLDEIVDYLVELGRRLDIEHNPHMQLARELSYAVAPTTACLAGRQKIFAPRCSLGHRGFSAV